MAERSAKSEAFTDLTQAQGETLLILIFGKHRYFSPLDAPKEMPSLWFPRPFGGSAVHWPIQIFPENKAPRDWSILKFMWTNGSQISLKVLV